MTPALVLAPALLCVVVLSGCTPTTTVATPTAPPSVTPVFASEDAALAAAVAAYERYSVVSTEIAHGGGLAAETIATVAVGDALSMEQTTFTRFREMQLRGVGHVTFDNTRLRSYDPGTGDVGLYLCLDVSATDVIGADGASILSGERQNRVPFELGFEYDSGSGELRLANSDVWIGEDFC